MKKSTIDAVTRAEISLYIWEKIRKRANINIYRVIQNSSSVWGIISNGVEGIVAAPVLNYIERSQL
jgi:hypothetical protein